jgi:hypothetical protein
VATADRIFYRETRNRTIPASLIKDKDAANFLEDLLHLRTHVHRTGEPFLWPDGLTIPLNAVALSSFPLNRTTYAALFQVYSTTFGVGDGSTTFDGPTITAPTGTVVLVQT